jgi:hypothetical protein
VLRGVAIRHERNQRLTKLYQSLHATRTQHCGSFSVLKSRPPPRALKVEALIKDDAETLVMWRDAISNPQGQHHHDNVIMKAEQGNSVSYTLSRLKRQSPGLFERVVAYPAMTLGQEGVFTNSLKMVNGPLSVRNLGSLVRNQPRDVAACSGSECASKASFYFLRCSSGVVPPRPR